MRERVMRVCAAAAVIVSTWTAACSSTPAATGTAGPRPAPQDTIATMNDPRVNLAPGAKNTAGIATKNMRLVSWSDKPPAFDSARGLTYINSDLAFKGNYVYQGNFSGFSIWDVSNPARPVLLSTMVCPTDQGDPSIIGNLLFISAESGRSRTDCGMGGRVHHQIGWAKLAALSEGARMASKTLWS